MGPIQVVVQDGNNLVLEVTPTPNTTVILDRGIAGPVGPAGPGDVNGPASSTDNAIARFDGTTGKVIQNSNVTIDDSGNLTYSAGTANGVAYLNGSKVLTTGSALTFNGTNTLTIDGGTTGYIVGPSGEMLIGEDAGGLYIGSGFGVTPAIPILLGHSSTTEARYQVGSSAYHRWLVGSEQMRLTSTGLGIGTSSPSYKFQASGGKATTGIVGSFINVVSGGNAKIHFSDEITYNWTAGTTGNAFTISSGEVSTIAGTERLRLDSSGNLGLGVTPSASNLVTFQSEYGLFTGNSQVNILQNAYYNSGFLFTGTGYATQYQQLSGQHIWKTSTASGSANGAITFTQAMTLGANGFLGVGVTSPTYAFITAYHQNGTTTNSNTQNASIAMGPAGAIQPILAMRWTNTTTGISGVGFVTQIVNDTVNSNAFEMYTTGASPLIFGTNTTERMRITSAGDVGIGISSPSTYAGYTTVSIGNTSGGEIDFYASGTNVSQIYGNTNGTNISSLGSRATIFNTNGVERARIDSSGNLLVGKTATDASVAGIQLESTGTVVLTRDSAVTLICNRKTNDGLIVSIRRDNTEVGSISATTTLTSYNVTSDYRLKNTIAPMTGALAKVALLKPCTYKWNVNGSDGEGFIAHELAEVVPQCVTGQKDAVDAEGKPQYQGIDTSFLVATLTAAIQEQQAIIQTLTTRVAALEAA